MWEEHSKCLVLAGVGSFVVYCCALVFYFCQIFFDFTDSQLIHPFMGEGISNTTLYLHLPVSLAYWSKPVWGVVYIFQSFWIVFTLVSFFRQTAMGPAYNNPKLLSVPVHVFFCLSALTQMGWVVLLERHYLILALMLIIISTGCSIICVCENYRVLDSALSILEQQDRTCDIWVTRLLAHNPMSFLCAWITLHATLTLSLFLTYGMHAHHVTPFVSSIVQLSVAAVIIFIYVLTDLCVLDTHARFVVLPYLAFVLFTAAQLNKNWPDLHSPVFILMATLTAFAFVAVFLKVTVLLCRYAPQRPSHVIAMNIVTRPLRSEMEEETYLLQSRP